MYCRNCGAELSEDAKFCPKCGTKVQQSSGEPAIKADVAAAVGKAVQASKQAGSELRQKLEEAYGEKTGRESDAAEEKQEDANRANTGAAYADQIEEEKKESPDQADSTQTQAAQAAAQTAGRTQENVRENRFSKLWNHPVFTMIAVKFGNILDILISVLGILLAVRLFSEGALSGILIGAVCLVGGVFGIIRGIRNFLLGNKEPETADSLNKKKRNLCIGAAVILFALFVLVRTGGGIYSRVQSISFDQYGPETIGEIVDENIKGAEWSQEKLDSKSRLVTVEGYCPMYGQDIRITFFYEETDSSYYEVTIWSIEFLEDGEAYDDSFSVAIWWEAFY